MTDRIASRLLLPRLRLWPRTFQRIAAVSLDLPKRDHGYRFLNWLRFAILTFAREGQKRSWQVVEADGSVAIGREQ